MYRTVAQPFWDRAAEQCVSMVTENGEGAGALQHLQRERKRKLLLTLVIQFLICNAAFASYVFLFLDHDDGFE